MQTTIVVVEPPAIKPITLEELYEYLKLDPLGSPPTHPQDGLLQDLIAAGTDHIEALTNRSLIARTLCLVRSEFPRGSVFLGSRGFYERLDDYDSRPPHIELLKPPLLEVVSVKYYDLSNTLVTMPTTDYFVSTMSLTPALMIVDGKWWPQTYSRPDAVQITYRTGYLDPTGSPTVSVAAQREAVPERLRHAIKIDVQLAFDDLSVEKRTAYKNLMHSLVESYRVRTF